MAAILSKKALSGMLDLAQLTLQRDLPLKEFLMELDEFNHRALPALCSAKLSERHAKAILIKFSNLAVAKFQYLRSHSSLVSQPFGVLVDPSNHCPLACPGCIQRKKNSHVPNLDWAPGMLKEECFSSLLDVSGPWMTVLSLYNWGEPLLNPKTPLFINNARSYLLRTSISTNLSVKFDIDALLDSGLDYLLVSIDGASQSVYEKYRVGGTLSLALSNLEKLTSRRSQLPDCHTFIVWRFLVFEHNRHEMDQVESIAKDIGVDMLMFAEPYDVSGINPEITKPDQPLSRNCIYRPLGTRASDSLLRAGQAGLNQKIDMVWEDGWQSRYLGQEESSKSSKKCKWLYSNFAMDATGRIMPCCYDPLKEPTSIFGNIRETETFFNSASFSSSRRYFATSGEAPDPKTACPQCPYKDSSPNVSAKHAVQYLKMADVDQALDPHALELLADW